MLFTYPIQLSRDKQLHEVATLVHVVAQGIIALEKRMGQKKVSKHQ